MFCFVSVSVFVLTEVQILCIGESMWCIVLIEG